MRNNRADELLLQFQKSSRILMPCGEIAVRNNAVTYAKKLSLITRKPCLVVRESDGQYRISESENLESGILIGKTSLSETEQGLCCYFN